MFEEVQKGFTTQGWCDHVAVPLFDFLFSEQPISCAHDTRQRRLFLVESREHVSNVLYIDTWGVHKKSVPEASVSSLRRPLSCHTLVEDVNVQDAEL